MFLKPTAGIEWGTAAGRLADGAWQPPLRRSAALGALIWLGWLVLAFRADAAVYYPTIAAPLLLAVLVAVPLALALLPPPAGVLRSLLLLLQPAAALSVAAALLLPAGALAAVLALPWTAFTALVALEGLVRLRRGRGRPAGAACCAVGMVYLVVGGGWLALSRLGARPLGFGDTIVLLTAVHFHYAGLLAPLLVGLAGGALPPTARRVRRAWWLCTAGVLLGPPLLAAGITFARPLEIAAAVLLAGGLVGTMLLALRFVAPRLVTRARVLFTISALSVLLPMVLAVLYALGPLAAWSGVSPRELVPLHGWVNALGFVLCGLLAWTVQPPLSAVESGHAG